MRTVLLKGEVPIRKAELEKLRRQSAELEDYMAAIRSPKVSKVRTLAVTLRKINPDNQWAQGVVDYERALGDALLDELRRRS